MDYSRFVTVWFAIFVVTNFVLFRAVQTSLGLYVETVVAVLSAAVLAYVICETVVGGNFQQI